jgi:hypothetical protein
VVEVVIDRELVEYFTRLIEDIVKQTRFKLYRYVTPPESPYWVAFDGFRVSESYIKKMCVTLSPVFYTYVLGEWLRGAFIVFDKDLLDLAYAVAYTTRYPYDPVSGEYTYRYEMELAVHYRPEKGYKTDFVRIDHISKAYLLRGVQLTETEYRKAGVLPYYLHGRVYGIYPYTLLSEDLVKRLLALLIILRLDDKMDVAFAYTWDKYWEVYGRLSAKPNYGWAEKLYAQKEFKTAYTTKQIAMTCKGSLIPPEVCNGAFQSEVADIMRDIYGLVGTEITVELEPYAEYGAPSKVSSEALNLYRRFHDLLETPVDAERLIKWWFKDLESLEDYLRSIRAKLYEPKVSVDLDPTAYLM